MKNRSTSRAFLAGFLATLAMTFLSLFAKGFGAPFLDWTNALTSYFGGNPIVGHFFFFMAGIFLAILYVTLFHDRLPGTSWKRGIFFAILMWLGTGAILAPLLGMGFFMGGVLIAMGTLVSYLVYGAVLGLVYDA